MYLITPVINCEWHWFSKWAGLRLIVPVTFSTTECQSIDAVLHYLCPSLISVNLCPCPTPQDMSKRKHRGNCVSEKLKKIPPLSDFFNLEQKVDFEELYVKNRRLLHLYMEMTCCRLITGKSQCRIQSWKKHIYYTLTSVGTEEQWGNENYFQWKLFCVRSIGINMNILTSRKCMQFSQKKKKT